MNLEGIRALLVEDNPADYRLPGRVKVVIDEHNIEYELRMRTFQQESALLRKLYNWSESSRLRPFELDLCGRADLVLVTSDRERLTLQRLLPESIFEVVPNGVDLEVFCRRPDVQEVPGRIIFTGSMDYYPNVQAVVHFAKKCWPIIRARIPDASWQIVGKNPLSEVRELARLPGVSVTGTVPDVRPYLLEATVVVVPLLIGSGTRLKILEAWAMGKAIVSTSLGCEGLEAIPGEHLIVEEHPEAFAEAVVALMHDPGQRTLLGTAARRLVEAEYSWHRSGTRLLEVIEQVFSSDAELQASKPE